MFNQRIDFLIIGAQKSGTSSLFHYLAQHPKIYNTPKKEISFFSYDKYFNQGIKYYNKYFGVRSLFKKKFEATPEYLYFDFVPKRIHDIVPNVKLVVVLRNPIERAYSAYTMYERFKGVSKKNFYSLIQDANPEFKNPIVDYVENTNYSFEEAIEYELENPDKIEPSFLRRGLYANQLLRYYKLFNTSKILVIADYELRSFRIKTLNKVCSFLGIQKQNWNKFNLSEKHVQNYNHSIEQSKVYKWLLQYYQQPNKDLFSLINKKFKW